ncbi:hypothetical protein [Nocardia crassostreae]|uniref:hypothetical protein n=1 Tax=Nocardia crassostreae TaxID=53428 RepID=UPI000834AC7D|nr:hypothetical protein [Nocardia crassostreae]
MSWAAGPYATIPLIEEMYEAARTPIPELRSHAPELGTVAARRAGQLVGWATVYPATPGPAIVQHLYLPREIHRLTQGFYDDEPPTAEERELVVALYRRAAEHARAAGLRALEWGDADQGPGHDATMTLGARAVEVEKASALGLSWREHVRYRLDL